MKVLKVYNKDSNIRCFGKNVFKATESFLATFPQAYGDCYRQNLETLELMKVDEFVDASMAGYYNTQANVIYFNNGNAVGHEIFHMASNDLVKGDYAFYSHKDIENALIEGMTEYFTAKAYDLERPGAYPFEVFCVTMLENIPDIFKSYFIPNDKEFISLFPNRRDIYSLLYSLDIYNGLYLDFLEADCSGKESNIDINLLRDSIKDSLGALVDIELSLEKDPRELKKYDFKFMEYVGSDRLGLLFQELYPKYYEYADKLIDRKIRKRIK